MKIRKIAAQYLFPVSSPALKYGILICDTSGEILDLIDTKGNFKEEANLEFYNGILVPGFVSYHFNSDYLILEHLKALQEYYPDIELTELINWATLNGAKSLNYNNNSGTFERHKKPGINLISDIDFFAMKLTRASQVKKLI